MQPFFVCLPSETGKPVHLQENGMLDHVRGLINYAAHIESEVGDQLKSRFNCVVESAGLEL